MNFWPAVLEFYNQYHLFINGVILAYVVLILIGKSCYQKIQKAIFHELQSTYGEKILHNNLPIIRMAIEKQILDWEKFAKCSWSPIISTENSLIFRPKTKKFLKHHFTEKRIQKLIDDFLSNNGG